MLGILTVSLFYFLPVISCGDPGSPINGEILGSEFTYGKTVIYDCNPGYQLKGTRSRTCQLDGSWSGLVATCVSKLLFDFPYPESPIWPLIVVCTFFLKEETDSSLGSRRTSTGNHIN